MSIKKLIIAGIIVAGIIALLLFQNRKVNKDYSRLTDFQLKKFERMRNELKGKKLSSISEIIGDSVISSDSHIVFYYNPGDCGSYIKKGQFIVRRFNARLKNQHIFLISARMQKDSLDKRFLGTDKVYIDQHNKFMRESGYTYTPLFLVLNKKAKVLNSFQVLSGINDSAKVNSFILKSVNLLQ